MSEKNYNKQNDVPACFSRRRHLSVTVGNREQVRLESPHVKLSFKICQELESTSTMRQWKILEKNRGL